MSTTELAAARQGRERHYRLGVMDGTFGPIHHGHLVATSGVAVKFFLDEAVFVPTGVPWQKTRRNVTQAEDRYLMTVITTASNPRFSVSRVDIDWPGNTYIIDTLRGPRAECSDDVGLFFITGADVVWQILAWRGVEQLFDLAHFVGVTRPGVPATKGDLAYLPSDKVMLLEVPALAISSTDYCTRAQRVEPIWYPVPGGTVQYIVKRSLYPHPEAGAPVDNI